MPRKKKAGPKQPGYLHHKASGRAFVILGGRRVYLGKHGTKESHERYKRALFEFFRDGGVRRSDAEDDSGLLVVSVIAAYWDHARTYYRREDGTPTGTAELKVRYALRPLRELYGETLASEFGPSSLEAVRTFMVKEEGLSRNVVNQRIGIIRQMFRWAEAKEMVPSGTFHNLSTLAHLKAGRSDAHETEKVLPVAWQDVNATIEHLTPTIKAMVLLQWETAMRPGEVIRMRACDIDRSDPGMWLYTPEQHKTKHRGKGRVVPLFERCQEYLRPFFEDIEVGKDPRRYLFAPEGHRARHDHYSTTHYAQAIRRGVAAVNAPGLHGAILKAILPEVPEESHERLTRSIQRLVTNLDAKRIAHAIKKQTARFGFDPMPIIAAAERALADHKDTVASWSPNQLRHAAATRIERQLSVEDARIVLGHASPRTTANYIAPDVQRAFDKLRKLG